MATMKDFFKQRFYGGIFADISDRFSEEATDITTVLNVSDKVSFNQYWENLARALKYWNGLFEINENVFVGYKNNQYVVEYERDGETATSYVFIKPDPKTIDDTMEIRAFNASFSEDGAFAISRVSAKDFDNSLIIMGFFPKFNKELPVFSEHMDRIAPLEKKDFINVGEWTEDDKDTYIAQIGYIKNTCRTCIPFKDFETYSKFTEKEMAQALDAEWTPIVGKPIHLKVKENKKKAVSDKLIYQFDENKFLIPKPENWITPDKERTPEELSKIPQIEKIAITPLAKKYYNAIMNTYSVAFRNFYLLGGAGIGKSTMCRVLAFMLGLPYSDTTCYAEMEMTDILGGVFPINTDEGSKREVSEDIYESVYDELGVSLSMLRDKTSFELAYEVLTGTAKEGVTEDEVFSIFVKKVSEKLAERIPAKKEEGIIYKYVPSELVKSISADGIGGVHEIKEPTVIRNEGVLVGLNTLLAEGTLTLPNGDVVSRNPNSIIIMTSNADYAGCQMLNESVISRMHMVENLDFLSVDEMVERAKQIFGDKLEDEYYKAMASVVKNVESWIASDDENMGIASFREYQNWIEFTLKTASSDCPTKKELIESAESTIKFKASQIKANLANDFEICYKPLENF